MAIEFCHLWWEVQILFSCPALCLARNRIGFYYYYNSTIYCSISDTTVNQQYVSRYDPIG